MRALSVLALLALVPFSAATSAKYDMFVDETKIGVVTLTFEKLPNGGTKFVSDNQFDFRGDKSSNRTEDRYDKDSRPVSSQITEAFTEVDGKLKREWRLDYGKDALTVTTVSAGKKTVKSVAYPKGKSIAKPSQSWFFVTTPMPGTTSKEWSYDVHANRWTLHTRRYVGLSEVEFKGKKIRAFELHDSGSGGDELIRQWVDGQGMPYVVEFGGSNAEALFRLVRAE